MVPDFVQKCNRLGAGVNIKQSANKGKRVMNRAVTTPEPNHPQGVLYALLAYGSWGLLPMYWKIFVTVPAIEVLSHRMVWSMVFLFGILMVQQRLAEVRAIARSRQIFALLLTSTLLAVNWGIYIYGVNTDRVIEASLGYYINPLVTVMLGLVVLRERLNARQWIALGLAAAGVLSFVVNLGQVPAIALGLAFSFALYGLLRKMVAIAPLTGLAIETLYIAPFMGLWLLHQEQQGVGNFGGSGLAIAFIGAGVVTSMPLLWFNNAAKRLPLSSIGFLQYISPSLQLLLGVVVYHEPFTQIHMITFGLIWVALAIYSGDRLWINRATKSSVEVTKNGDDKTQ
jgi:chloramphenicol-sensitive protein RarD